MTHGGAGVPEAAAEGHEGAVGHGQQHHQALVPGVSHIRTLLWDFGRSILGTQ